MNTPSVLLTPLGQSAATFLARNPELFKLPRITWTATDQARALRQGWGIFNHDYRGIEIERFDSDPRDRFDSDDEAKTFVLKPRSVAGWLCNRTAFKAKAYLMQEGAI